MISPLSLLATSLALCASIANPTIAATTSSTTTSSPTPVCPQESQGIVKPTNGATINQVNDGNYDSTVVEVIYCSGAYFKISSIDASAWLTFPNTNYGQLLVKDISPDNKDAYAGYYSYRFNVTISPEDGDYATGERTLSVYETITGYYDPMEFAITSINVNFTLTNES